MAPDSFHQFTALPFELRRMIYLLASPPRFVHVKEVHEDQEDFEERFRTTVVQIKLHPSIAYLARNWRKRIPFPHAFWKWYDGRYQTTLERYGFKGPHPNHQPKHQPWEPTREVPSIPYDFLSENPQVAWELLRIGSFYSAVSIPVMLHVTSESRQVLIDYGYELAFRTRTCGPRTWFNFKTDVLYIGRYSPEWESLDPSPYHAILSGNDLWELGQFEPQDLKKVRRLALESSGHVVSSSYRTYPNVMCEISSILELFFTCVEELFLEEPGLRDPSHGLSGYMRRDVSQELWNFTPALEIDALSTIFERDEMVHSTGFENLGLKAYKDDNMGDGSQFFVDTARKYEEQLASMRDDHIRGGGSLVPYKIPKISLVYIGYPWMCRGLFDWRRAVWNRYQSSKEEESRSRAVEEALRSIDVPRKPIYEKNDDTSSLSSQSSDEFRDDMEAWEDLQDNFDHDHGYSEMYEEERARHNWLLTGTISAPEMG